MLLTGCCQQPGAGWTQGSGLLRSRGLEAWSGAVAKLLTWGQISMDQIIQLQNATHASAPVIFNIGVVECAMLQMWDVHIFVAVVTVVDFFPPCEGEKKTFPKCLGNKNTVYCRGGGFFLFPPKGTENVEYIYVWGHLET